MQSAFYGTASASVFTKLGITMIYVISKGHAIARMYTLLQRSDEAMVMKRNFPHVVLEEKDVPGASLHWKTFPATLALP